MNKVNIITLGCSKNLVDSENIATQLKAEKIEFVFDVFDTVAQTVVINTCGFIGDAKEESINTILEFAKAKQDGKIKNLHVIGCLSQRYKNELIEQIPEVDSFFGVHDIQEIVETLKVDYKKELIGEREISTPKHYAYLKISEGCDRTCAFCAIPLIRGKHISVSMEMLQTQAINLAKKGVKELILIAQDLSYYGLDIYKKQKLPELVQNLSEIIGIERIRLHYAYPANFPFEIIDIMKNNPKICKYIDIPFQHISTNVLKAMRRGHDKKTILKIIRKLREKIPDIAIRTTLLVGHPHETEKDFEELMTFVKESEIERLGVFTYSPEEETYADKNYEDSIPQKVKQDRANKIMELQQDISFELNQRKIGKILKVIIDKEDEKYYTGRTEFDSPEVDNEVLIPKPANIEIGNIYTVKITDAVDFDLYATIA